MSSNALVFLHVLAATALLGGLLTVAVLAAAGDLGARLALRASVLVAGAALATVAVGEVARARDDLEGTWVDLGTVLGYAALLLPSIALVMLARRSFHRGRGRSWVAGLAWTMVAATVVAAFVMAAKPG